MGMKELIDNVFNMQKVVKEFERQLEEARNNIANEIVKSSCLSLNEKQDVLDSLAKNDFSNLPEEIKKNHIFTELQEDYINLGNTKSLLKKSEQAITKEVNDTINEIKEIPGDVLDKTSKFLSKIVNEFKEGIQKANKFLSEKNQQFKSGAKNVIEAYKNTGIKVFEMVKESSERARQGFIDLGNAAREKLSELQKNANEAKENISRKASSVKDGMDKQLNKGEEIVDEKLTGVQKNVERNAAKVRDKTLKTKTIAQEKASQMGNAIKQVYNETRAKTKADNSFKEYKNNRHLYDNRLKKEIKTHNTKEAARDLINTIMTGQRSETKTEFVPSEYLKNLAKYSDKSLNMAKVNATKYQDVLEKNTKTKTFTGKIRNSKDLLNKINRAAKASQTANKINEIKPIGNNIKPAAGER